MNLPTPGGSTVAAFYRRCRGVGGLDGGTGPAVSVGVRHLDVCSLAAEFGRTIGDGRR